MSSSTLSQGETEARDWEVADGTKLLTRALGPLEPRTLLGAAPLWGQRRRKGLAQATVHIDEPQIRRVAGGGHPRELVVQLQSEGTCWRSPLAPGAGHLFWSGPLLTGEAPTFLDGRLLSGAPRFQWLPHL